MELLYFLIKGIGLVLVIKFILDTVQVYIKCKFQFQHQRNDDDNDIEEYKE